MVSYKVHLGSFSVGNVIPLCSRNKNDKKSYKILAIVADVKLSFIIKKTLQPKNWAE